MFDDASSNLPEASGEVSNPDDASSVQVVATDDGLLLLGDELALSRITSDGAIPLRPLSPRTMQRVSGLWATVSGLQVESGRWLRMDQASYDYVRQHGVGTVRAGVLRAGDIRKAGNPGSIAKHLRFERGGVLTPAASAGLAGIAAQQAIAAALQEIRDYLETIDAKLDELLKQRKIDALAHLGGVSLALDEAEAIRQETGIVSEVTWSKVQSVSLALQTMQAQCLAQLAALADDIAEHAGNPDRASEVLRKAGEDGPFWLGALARTMALQDRQYLLELARLEDADADQLEAHRRGIHTARADRARRIAVRLDAIRSAVARSAELTNLVRVANPLSSQRVTRSANEVNVSVAQFAAHASLEIERWSELEGPSWGGALKGLLGETRSHASSARSGVAQRVGALGSGVRQRRENALLRRAEQIRERRSDASAVAGTPADPRTAPPPTPSFAQDADSSTE